MRESSLPPSNPSFLSENESADSVHSGSGVLSSAQQDIFPGYNCLDAHNLPHSPILDPAHPWDESQQQPNDPTSAKTAAGPRHVQISRHRCDICKKSFVNSSVLKRHFETMHEYGRVYWACTVKSCKKYDKPVTRKDNLIRHCKTKHPTVDLKHFGL